MEAKKQPDQGWQNEQKRARHKIYLPLFVFVILLLLWLIFLIIKPKNLSTEPTYNGGYAPNGEFCEYGYNKADKQCCQDDDYSCEQCDLYGIYCNNKDHLQGDFYDINYFSKRVPDGDYDCADFKTWEEAQKVFIRDGGPGNDPYNLDFDRDGKACESLR